MIIFEALIAYLIAAAIYYTIHGIGSLLCRILAKDVDNSGQLRKTRGPGGRDPVFKRK